MAPAKANGVASGADETCTLPEGPPLAEPIGQTRDGSLPQAAEMRYLACADAAGVSGSVSVRAITAHAVPVAEIHWSCSYGNPL